MVHIVTRVVLLLLERHGLLPTGPIAFFFTVVFCWLLFVCCFVLFLLCVVVVLFGGFRWFSVFASVVFVFSFDYLLLTVSL